MNVLAPFLRWGWLLTIALFIPIALPVGGAQTKIDETFHSSCSSQVIAGHSCNFRSSPSTSSIVIRSISVGTPIRILRTWGDSDGSCWLHVQVNSLPLTEINSSPQRGWIKI